MNTHTAPGSQSRFTDLVVTGSREDITALQDLARRCGRLVYMSAPAPVSAADPRIRLVIRLTATD
ncbi:hypothetical protein V6U90_01115 [Micromonospora sp. CPCC 206060]|uniref:hypothetical protein n=1 Tax=Micromonospora sp. CPCC 206060 TaxID=3122406 RepID=UPI002FF1AB8F